MTHANEPAGERGRVVSAQSLSVGSDVARWPGARPRERRALFLTPYPRFSEGQEILWLCPAWASVIPRPGIAMTDVPPYFVGILTLYNVSILTDPCARVHAHVRFFLRHGPTRVTHPPHAESWRAGP